MFLNAYKEAVQVLAKKPFVLWGLSLMSGLLALLAIAFCFLLPIVWIPIILTLSAGMSFIYLEGLRGKSVNSDQLFVGFKNFAHVAGGMAWMYLWVFIWALIPLAGPIIAVVKAYSYAFTPYILFTRPELSSTEALRESMRETYGKKSAMFCADFVFGIAVTLVLLVLAGFSAIPFIGRLFGLLYLLGSIVVGIFSPLFTGLVRAYFYDRKDEAKVQEPEPEFV